MMTVKRSRLGASHVHRAAAMLAAGAMLVVAGCSGGGASATPSASDAPPASASSAPTTSAASSTPIKKVAFAVHNQAAGQFVEFAQRFVDYGKQVGIQVDIYNNDANSATAISNAQLMVQSKPDVIVDFPPVADATGRLTEIFQASGIPCIAVNIPIEGCPFFNQSQEVFAKLNAENFAKLMKEKGWDGTNTTVVIEQGSKLGPTVNIAVTKFYEEISKIVPGMTQVTADKITTQTTTISPQGLQIDTGVSASDSYTAFSQALQTIPKDRNIVVYTISDDNILGTYRALENAGRQDKAMLAGFGCDKNAIEGLRNNPAWVGESCGFFTRWGAFLLAMSQALKDGATPPETTFSSMVVLNKDNVNDYFKPGSTDPEFMPELPPESKYLEKTGILQKLGIIKGLS